MNQTDQEIHPLDADDPFSDAPQHRPKKHVAYEPLLRYSIRVLIVSVAIVFLSGLAAGNASPNSDMENVSLFLNQLGMLAMLGAFCSILLAYRLPQIKKLRMKMIEQPKFGGALTILLIANAVYVGLATVGLSSIAAFSAPLASVILMFGNTMIAGFFTTMIWWHGGFLRAYAIGALTSLAPSYLMGCVFVMSPFGRRFGFMQFAPLLLAVIVPPVTGVLCALYVYVLDSSNHAKVMNEQHSE